MTPPKTPATPKTTDDRDLCRGPPTRRDGPLRTASREFDAADARFLQLLEVLDRGATVLRAAAAPLGIILVIAVAVQLPCIPTSNRGADLTERYGAPHAQGFVADVYAVNRTHVIKQLRGPCAAERSPCVGGRASLLHWVWWGSHAREQWLTYERLVELRRDNVTQAPETFALDYERWRIYQRRYVSPEYETPRNWPEDQLVELSAALESRDWFLVDAAARNALIRKRDRRLVVLDGSLITGTQLRFRVACARVLDAAAALFCLAFRASDLPFVSQPRVARAPRVRFDDRSMDRRRGQSALIGVADAFATMSRLTS
jgi:hypothetical protein